MGNQPSANSTSEEWDQAYEHHEQAGVRILRCKIPSKYISKAFSNMSFHTYVAPVHTKNCTAPLGIWIRVVSSVVNPMPLMMRLWNCGTVSVDQAGNYSIHTFVKPPFGALLVTAKTNRSQVLTSSIASINCQQSVRGESLKT